MLQLLWSIRATQPLHCQGTALLFCSQSQDAPDAFLNTLCAYEARTAYDDFIESAFASALDMRTMHGRGHRWNQLQVLGDMYMLHDLMTLMSELAQL